MLSRLIFGNFSTGPIWTDSIVIQDVKERSFRMQISLLGTPKSHFTRKVRLLLDHLNVSYELRDIGDVSTDQIERFDGNPSLTVPVAMIGDDIVFDSDEIARHIISISNPGDDFYVRATSPDVLNTRSVLNAAMSAEVRLIVAQRLNQCTDGSRFFAKSKSILHHSLTWCASRCELFNPGAPTYLDFHFKSFWDHASHYGLIEDVWPDLRSVSDQLDSSEVVRKSSIPVGFD